MSSDVKIGETVYVAGNPKGLEGTFSDGIVSSKRGGYSNEHLQMTAPISPGSSGGPVLNRQGQVIGVSFMTLEGGQNLNFAIPSRYIGVLLARSGIVKPLAQGNQSISAESYYFWGCTKHVLGNYKGAVADYDKAIQLKPDYAKAYGNRGYAKYILGQHFAAITDYDKALQLKPDIAEVYSNRGVVKASLGQHIAAIADFDKAIHLEPGFADAYSNRGITKALLNRMPEAKQDLRTALRLAEQAGNQQLKAAIEKVIRSLE